MYHPIGLKPESAPPAPHLHAEPLAAGRLAGAKTACTVRRVPLGEARRRSPAPVPAATAGRGWMPARGR